MYKNSVTFLHGARYIFEIGHPETIRHLTFVEYMKQHPFSARAYSIIKQQLARQFNHDIVAYVEGKASYIRMIDYRSGVAQSKQLNTNDSVKLEPYNSRWKKLAIAEIDAIKAFIGLPFVDLQHLGSTAVKGLIAKPVVDIFIAISDISDAQKGISPLEDLGYLFWYGNPDRSHYRFVKGMPPCGVARTHHVHILQIGDEFKRRVMFKKLLETKPLLCDHYLTLKQSLVERYPNDREAYTEGKRIFINRALAEN